MIILKKEQIENFFEFLTKEVGLDPEKIYVTCFIGNEKYGIPKDTEAAEIWQNVFKKAGVEPKSLKLVQRQTAINEVLILASASSSMMTKKTGGAAEVVSKPLRLAILVDLTLKFSMILVRINKISKIRQKSSRFRRR